MHDPWYGRSLAAGTQFGRYRIVRFLGRGGMGAVYQATHLELKKPVAIKVLHPDLAEDPQVRARFVREGEAAARIRHPHVVNVTDVGVHEGLPFLVMELLAGESLEQLIKREGALDVERIADLLVPVLAAVDAAHEVGVIHRDLKPGNIFLARAAGGEVDPKVLDFGISRMVGEAAGGARLTQSQALLGTPHYMSPEHARDSRLVDARSDQYSLGAILYECATGSHPFRGTSVCDVLLAIVAGRFPPPRELRPTLTGKFQGIVLRAMSREPAQRFESVAALGRALLPYAGQKTRLLWEKALGREPDGRGAAPRPHASQDALADTCLGPAVATAPGLACTQLPPAGSRPAAVALTAGAAAFAAGGSTAGAAPGRAAAGPGGAALGPTAEVVRVRTRPWPIPLVGDPGMSTTAAVSGSVQGPPPRSYGLGLWVWAAAVLVVGVGVGLALVVRQPGPAAGRIDEQPAAAVKNPAGAFRPDALPPAMSAPLQFVPSSLADSAGRAAALHGRPRAADGAQRPDAASSPGRRHGRDARPDDAVTVGGRSTRSPRLEIEPEGRAAPSPRVAPAPATRATAGDSAAPAGATGAVGPAGPSLEVEP